VKKQRASGSSTSKKKTTKIAAASKPDINVATLQDVELFFAFVGPMGTNSEAAYKALEKALSDWKYSLEVIKLSDLVKGKPVFGNFVDNMPVDEHYQAAIKAGNKARERLNSYDALAQMAVVELAARRKQLLQKHGAGSSKVKLPLRQAYLFRSLKRREEIETLRRIYGTAFFVISIHAHRDARRDRLAKRIKLSHKEPNFRDKEIQRAEMLLNMDEYESIQFGQRVRDAFPEADFFTSSDAAEDLRESIGRFVSTIFKKSFVTPSRSELAMSQARAAAMRSADLSRQIGAVIATQNGEVVSFGCNDVPKFGGGQYWEGDKDDARDFHLTYDPNDQFKEEVISDFLGRMASRNWLVKSLADLSPPQLIEEAFKGEKRSFIDGSRVDSLIEFGRIMHAEMAAIVDAARRGVSIQGHDLYCTTFPCHMCSRLIIGAGIKRVIYIEPYPKSITHELYAQQVVVDPSSVVTGKVIFEPFSGVAPRRFFELFAFGKGMRKKEGRAYTPDPDTAQPRVEILSTAYLDTEVIITARLGKAMHQLTLGGN
jgi:deoxycytidylate deaminase